MSSVRKIDHVAVAVRDVDEAVARFRKLFGVEPVARELVASQHTEAVLLPIGESHIELIAPRGNAGLERFLDKRGPGLHHIAIEVRGLVEVLAALRALGVQLIDETPRVGARGHHVAFLHPGAAGGVLIELVEPAPEP